MPKVKMVKSASVTVQPTKGKQMGEAWHSPASRPSQSQLHNKAMLVGLSIRSWYPHTTDKKATKKLAADNLVKKEDMVRARKSLLPKEALKKVHSAEAKLRLKHYELTLPWDEAGYRIISSKIWLKYRTEIDALKQEFYTAVQEFLPVYPKWCEVAGVDLGNMHDLGDYPTAASVADRFGVSVDIKPIPQAADFRVDLGDEEVKRIQDQIESQQFTTGPGKVLAEIGVRLQEVVKKAVDRITAYYIDTDGNAKNSFRDSVIDNVIEVVDLLPMLNVLDDPQVEAFGKGIKAILNAQSAEDLRNDSGLRKEVVQSTGEILKKMNSYFGAPVPQQAQAA